VRFHKSYKRLLREKLLRDKGKRDLAATRVQCLFRVVLAKKIVRTRRIAFLEEKKTQEMLDDLEVSYYSTRYVVCLYYCISVYTVCVRVR
jgi:hypothetical protein